MLLFNVELRRRDIRVTVAFLATASAVTLFFSRTLFTFVLCNAALFIFLITLPSRDNSSLDERA